LRFFIDLGGVQGEGRIDETIPYHAIYIIYVGVVDVVLLRN
jgi:hypothetical protein